MRSLTEAEARVIRVLLAGIPGPERRMVRDAEVPRTTFQTIRTRAFINGWLKERFIPHPTLFGSERIHLFVAQPYTERWNESVRALRSLENLVVLWASPETLVGVVFDRPSSPTQDEIQFWKSFRRCWTVVPGNPREGVLAYFDFEGAWSRWTLGKEPLSYPQAFPTPETRTSPLSHEDWKAARRLLIRPFSSSSDRPGASLFGSSRLSRHERRLLNKGWLSRRVLPSFSEIPPLHGYRPERAVLITGIPLEGRTPRDLFADLTQRARVAPFLFAYDTERVLLGTLSPAPPHVARNRGSVVDVLQEHLHQIEVVREPIDSLYPVIDHRYDRLTLPPPAG
jgi:hypothetical protein